MLYGIGPKALGEQLEVDENDAAVFMETFKAKYLGTDNKSKHFHHGFVCFSKNKYKL